MILEVQDQFLSSSSRFGDFSNAGFALVKEGSGI